MDIDMKCFSIALAMTSAVFLSGCNGGGGEGSANARVLDAEIEGNWTAKGCSKTRTNEYLANGSSNIVLTFEGNLMTSVETTYMGPNCSEGPFEINTYVSRINLQGDTVSLDGESVTRIDAEVIDYNFQYYSQQELDAFSSQLRQSCGKVPALGEVVHEKDCDVPDSSKRVGQKKSGIYRVDNDVFHSEWSETYGDYPEYLYKNLLFSSRYYRQ